MRAIVITEAGGPEVLEWQEVPEPTVRPGEVLIEVTASAVNRADVMQRQGFYNPPPGDSPYPGLECSGVIIQGGYGFEPGDQVCALLGGGGYAERVAVPWEQVMPIPENISITDAAGLPEVVCTVWSNVFMLARLRRGETLLVHGGASGIGTMAVQLAKAHGAHVVATVGSHLKGAAVCALGADEVVNYREEDFSEKVRADVILDIMGAKYLAGNVRALKTGGRLVVIGLQGGIKAELDLLTLLNKRAAVHGTTLRSRPADEKGAVCRGVVENVWPLLSAGAVRPVVHTTLPMAQAAEAHRLLDSGEHVGKILLLASSPA
ncbi:NAD(P)H-quinone oxidoreductase [Nonomuraea soli]|uniref:Putative PIG3 family NAD(P)H quinone oxidoreductase n=1 Tax=Nonomuraea soli TaxID=1032476 RepID=A0A7W0CI95_9ACTN|nr:NAD(P)H-quinone oxidoreductase [Nonomuraea soli]MBA2891658.1 putative PIG3 family NAD(P)H quinone oxidoreductase [Nonomuraea soli]